MIVLLLCECVSAAFTLMEASVDTFQKSYILRVVWKLADKPSPPQTFPNQLDLRQLDPDLAALQDEHRKPYKVGSQRAGHQSTTMPDNTSWCGILGAWTGAIGENSGCLLLGLRTLLPANDFWTIRTTTEEGVRSGNPKLYQAVHDEIMASM